MVPSPGIESKSADVAQLVEQLIRNQQVIGSSPIVGSKYSAIQDEGPLLYGGRSIGRFSIK